MSLVSKLHASLGSFANMVTAQRVGSMVQRSANQYLNLKYISMNRLANSKHRSLHWNTDILVPQPCFLASGSSHSSLCLLGGSELILSDGKYGSGHWFSMRWRCHLSILCVQMWVSSLFPHEIFEKNSQSNYWNTWSQLGKRWKRLTLYLPRMKYWTGSVIIKMTTTCQAGDWKCLLIGHFLLNAAAYWYVFHFTDLHSWQLVTLTAVAGRKIITVV